MKNQIKFILDKLKAVLDYLLPTKQLVNLYDLELRKEFKRRQNEHPNPLCKFGLFGFSQNDEDGITIEILRRLGVEKGVFCEFGVGNGTENNTLILLSMGWSGAWFDGQDIALDTSRSNRLVFTKSWITRENIVGLFCSHVDYADVVSIDLDGNDIYMVEELLKNKILPKLYIVEYNAKFPPQVRFEIKYNPKHVWGHDDYFGASLASFVNIFTNYNYRLVCCNIAGCNAFFIKNEFEDRFADVPDELSDLYVDPYYFTRSKIMHKTSVRTLQRFIE